MERIFLWSFRLLHPEKAKLRGRSFGMKKRASFCAWGDRAARPPLRLSPLSFFYSNGASVGENLVFKLGQGEVLLKFAARITWEPF